VVFADKTWHTLGLPDRPITIMREYLTVLKALFAGEVVTYDGAAFKVADFSLDRPARVPIYLAALGPQMLRLAGSLADGVCLNWATPQQIAESAQQVAAGAQLTGRDPSDIPLSMYIRVCVDDDVERARTALAAQVLGYGLARPGVDPKLSYRGLFARMGFDDVLQKLEEKRAAGLSIRELTPEVPDDLLMSLGYFGSSKDAAKHFRRLAVGLDEVIVRVITARPGIDAVLEAMDALTPEKIRATA